VGQPCSAAVGIIGALCDNSLNISEESSKHHGLSWPRDVDVQPSSGTLCPITLADIDEKPNELKAVEKVQRSA
jgi:hypothetical protein